jgi:ATP-dependent Clp protease ATP-binding subunit ClpA
MYERFTDRARKVMQLANQEAQRLHHEYIGTEHILLGLVKEGSGVAANVLKNLDIDLRKIRSEIDKSIQMGPDVVTMGTLPQTPRAKKVIEYTVEEARNLNHNYIGTEHLLLGLLREEEGLAAQILVNLGLGLEKVRNEVLQFLGHETGAAKHDLVPRRAGLWPRRQQLSRIFVGGLLTTFGGALAGLNFLGEDGVNSSALIAGAAYIIAVAIACWTSPTRKSAA